MKSEPGKKRRRSLRAEHLRLVLAGLLFGLAGVSCQPSGPSQPPQPAAPAAPSDAAAGPAGEPAAPLPAGPGPGAAGWIDQALKSTVKIFVVTDGPRGEFKTLGGCSGSLIDPSGIILTNWHCVGRTDVYGEDKTGVKLGIQHGELYHSQGLTVVGLTEDPKDEPVPTYVGLVKQGTADLDIAVVKLFKTLDERQPMPRTLPAPILALGDSDKLKPGDQIHVFGYPGVGGETVTKSSAEMSGFFKQSPFRLDMRIDSFKMVPVPSGPGNSGGPATDARGEQMGIYSFGGGGPGGAALGGAFFVNLAKPFIERAKSDAFDPIKPRLSRAATVPAPPPPGQPPAPPQAPATGSFGPPAFGTGVQGGQLVGQATSFPAGTKGVAALFDHRGVRPATPWGYVLRLDGEAVIDKPNGFKWEGGTEGKWSISFNNGQEPLPNGRYELSVFLNGQAVQRGSFSVAGAAAPPQQPPAAKGVTVIGQIVDADTRRGIAGAVFIVLKPGVTVKQFVDADGDLKLVATYAEAGANGEFRTPDPLARGASYSLVVAADGYRGIGEDNGLKLIPDHPAEHPLNPIRLQKK